MSCHNDPCCRFKYVFIQVNDDTDEINNEDLLSENEGEFTELISS